MQLQLSAVLIYYSREKFLPIYFGGKSMEDFNSMNSDYIDFRFCLINLEGIWIVDTYISFIVVHSKRNF